MQKTEATERAVYLMRTAARMIEDHLPGTTIFYDETFCDGGCLSGELKELAEEMENASKQ